jgi:hypothetical protein
MQILRTFPCRHTLPRVFISRTVSDFILRSPLTPVCSKYPTGAKESDAPAIGESDRPRLPEQRAVILVNAARVCSVAGVCSGCYRIINRVPRPLRVIQTVVGAPKINKERKGATRTANAAGDRSRRTRFAAYSKASPSLAFIKQHRVAGQARPLDDLSRPIAPSSEVVKKSNARDLAGKRVPVFFAVALRPLRSLRESAFLRAFSPHHSQLLLRMSLAKHAKLAKQPPRRPRTGLVLAAVGVSPIWTPKRGFPPNRPRSLE